MKIRTKISEKKILGKIYNFYLKTFFNPHKKSNH